MVTQQYKTREKTDSLFFGGRFDYNSAADELIRFVEKNQLKDRELWHMIAEQFASSPDDEDNGWRGEYWGKLMRGACMTYKYTRDEELYDCLESSARELLSYQDSLGRFSTYSPEKEFHGWDMWSRKYVLLGFLHFIDICKSEELKKEIISAMCRHLDYIISKIGADKLSITKTSEIWQGINSSSILEPVVRMYNLTNKKEYLDFAAYIVENGGADECNIFNLAYEDKLAPYQYPVIKAYELMSCFEGLLEYYRVTGIEKWRTACENFAKKIISTEITIIGCAGCEHEVFNNSSLMQTYTKYDGLMLETCVTVTWMKLCFQLLCLTGESVYADCIEQSAYNALFGAVNTDASRCTEKTFFDVEYFRDVYNTYAEKKKDINGGGQCFDSYSPLRADIRGRAVGGFKPMYNGSAYCGCCIAIGAAGLALVPLASVTEDRNGYIFSLYINGSADMSGAEFEIKTDYPACGRVEITVNPKKEQQFAVRLRIPSFSQDTKISVNADELPNVKCGEYYMISKRWEKGDKIVLDFDMNLRLVRGMENPEDELSSKQIAVLYGPIVLAREARFGSVGEVLDVRGESVSAEKADTIKFKHMCEFDVTVDGKTIKMADYASCGKTWDDNSRLEAWIMTK